MCRGGFTTQFYGGLNAPISITFRNCISDGDGIGFATIIGPSDCAGILYVSDCTVLSPKKNGFRCSAANLRTKIDGLYIHNPAQSQDSRAMYASGFAILCDFPAYDGKTKWAGNIERVATCTCSRATKKAPTRSTSTNSIGEIGGFQNLDIEIKTNLPDDKGLYKGDGPFRNTKILRFPTQTEINALRTNCSEHVSFWRKCHAMEEIYRVFGLCVLIEPGLRSRAIRRNLNRAGPPHIPYQ